MKKNIGEHKARKLVPVVLSGGVGSRLWPVSREAFPKPFIKMFDGQSLLFKTYQRAIRVAEPGHILTVTNREYYFMSKDELQATQHGQGQASHFLLEPTGRNTAPAIAIAAKHAVESWGGETLLLVLPADHHIADIDGFAKSVAQAEELANENLLVTFGIHPTHPATGFGYIEKGIRLPVGNRVSSFVEKPNESVASEYLASGKFLWNSGIFCFKAGVILQELENYAPDLALAVEQCWKTTKKERQKKPTDLIEFSGKEFETVPSISIDYAVMEKSDKVAVISAGFDWSDVGTWTAISHMTAPDADNNRANGDALFIDSRNTFIKSEDRFVAALGTDNLLIVDTPDALLVAHVDKANEVREVVGALKQQDHPACSLRRTGIRPWGRYTILEQGERYKIKHIEVLPGRSLSLQMHHHRSEHWVVVSGMAKVSTGNEERFVGPNESTYIPPGSLHKLSNPGLVKLVLVEVQSGEYLEEDDIVRFQDDFNRIIPT